MRVEFSESLFKKRIASLLPAQAAAPARQAQAHGNSNNGAVDLSDLWNIGDNEEFVQEAYRLILGRECDVSGFVNYLEMLRANVPRRVVVLQLVNSEEARGKAVRFTGIPASAPIVRPRALPSVRGLPGRLIALARDILRRPLYARFDALDHKLQFVLREIGLKSESISVRTDDAFWSLSQKIDTRTDELRSELTRLSQTTHTAFEDYHSRLAALELGQMRLREELVDIGNRVAAGAGSTPPLIAAEPGVVEHFRGLLQPGMIVADIGAGIGVYTLCAARALASGGRIHSFESSPRLFRVLQENLRPHPGVQLRQCPIGDVPLDEALASEPRVDLVRIAVPGLEAAIFQGMRGIVERSPGLRILMEFAPDPLRRSGIDPACFLEELSRAGFTLRVVDESTGALTPIAADRLLALSSAHLDLACGCTGGAS